MPTRPGSWSGTCLSTPRSPARTSTAPALRGRRRGRRPTQGAIPNDKSPGVGRDEPDDHGIGRSRGGLSTKSHALVDGQGRLLTLIVGPGHAGDSPVLPLLLGELRVARRGPGLPRPDRRCCARTRRTARAGTCPARDHAGSRPSSPRRATRPPTANDAAAPAAARSPTTPRTTRTATSSNGSSTASSTGVPSPAATTSTPPSTAEASSWPPSSTGSSTYETGASRDGLIPMQEPVRSAGAAGHLRRSTRGGRTRPRAHATRRNAAGRSAPGIRLTSTSRLSHVSRWAALEASQRPVGAIRPPPDRLTCEATQVPKLMSSSYRSGTFGSGLSALHGAVLALPASLPSGKGPAEGGRGPCAGRADPRTGSVRCAGVDPD